MMYLPFTQIDPQKSENQIVDLECEEILLSNVKNKKNFDIFHNL